MALRGREWPCRVKSGHKRSQMASWWSLVASGGHWWPRGGGGGRGYGWSQGVRGSLGRSGVALRLMVASGHKGPRGLQMATGHPMFTPFWVTISITLL
jgi:hypothetical protein